VRSPMATNFQITTPTSLRSSDWLTRRRVTSGSLDACRRWLADHLDADIAYIAGYEWALWDYEDANGLSHDKCRDTAPGWLEAVSTD
jgi:hypothetical protein